MRLKLILLAALFAAAPRPAFAGCDEDTIDTISGDGDLIVLQSSGSYDVDAADQSKAARWTENDEVLVCDGKIINKDENGESVDASPH